MFAVEFTDMANHARRLVSKNGMEDVVEVIQCSVEELQLDAKVRGGFVLITLRTTAAFGW